MRVLAVNAGSSSLRLALFEEQGDSIARVRDAHYGAGEIGDAAILSDTLGDEGRADLTVHRVVHGGRYSRAQPLDAEVEHEIERYAAVAPLHNPAALRWVRACRTLLGEDAPRIAVFDTAFYHGLPEVAVHYALPGAVSGRYAIRRYGFHGIAHQAMWRQWCAARPEIAQGGRVISLQLGGGCSATAVARGRAVDTSMGFTPLEGLMMTTRSGDVDPGLLTWLQREAGWDADRLEQVLTRDSGLAGVSGTSGDMRELLASRDPRAALAVDMFCYRARKYIGAYLAVLGGADAILFGGGIGEHSAEVRRRIVQRLEGLGIELDEAANESVPAAGGVISAAGSAVELRVTPVDEAKVMVEEALEVVRSQS